MVDSLTSISFSSLLIFDPNPKKPPEAEATLTPINKRLLQNSSVILSSTLPLSTLRIFLMLGMMA